MTLSQAAVITKQAITITIITIVVSIVSFVGYKIWYAYYLASLPPIEEKPDLKFGQLPFPDFPKSSVSTSNFTYSVDTATGNLPVVGEDTGFPKIIKVYFVTQTRASLLSGEKSRELAEKFDIKTQPQILSETNYLFKENEKTLNVNLDTGNFSYKLEATISGQEALEEDARLISGFEQILKNLDVYQENLREGRNKILHMTQGETEIAKVSLWPPAVETKSIFTSQFDTSDIFATIYKSGSDLKNYLSLDFTYHPVDLSTFATYPTKNADVAFEDLKMGKGVVIVEPTKPQVSISSIYLGYFLSKNYSPYLQPIYVFEGANFAAYVPAISEEFLAANAVFPSQAR